jgi:hypothetical protein
MRKPLTFLNFLIRCFTGKKRKVSTVNKILFALALVVFSAASCTQAAPQYEIPEGGELVGVVEDADSRPCILVIRAVQYSRGEFSEKLKEIVLNDNRSNFCARGKTPRTVWETYVLEGDEHYFMTRPVGRYALPKRH